MAFHRKLVQIGTPPVDFYDGILMRANPRLHEQAFSLFDKYAPRSGKGVDLGAGQGAFSARLRDHGYSVIAVDKNPSDFKAGSVDFLEVDFDDAGKLDQFKQNYKESFDFAVGMEVIEHVENPWEYTRLLLSLVKRGGIVMITTPNAESLDSRIEFLFTGKFVHFDTADFVNSGHVNPLTFHELDLIFKNLDVEVLERRSICELPLVSVSRKPATMIKSLFSLMIRPFAGSRATGDLICYIVQKK